MPSIICFSECDNALVFFKQDVILLIQPLKLYIHAGLSDLDRIYRQKIAYFTVSSLTHTKHRRFLLARFFF